MVYFSSGFLIGDLLLMHWLFSGESRPPEMLTLRD